MFAVEADNVTEVVQRGVINNVPLASPAISGLLNLRGRIVPAIDLRLFLEFPAVPPSIKQISLIVDVNNEWYCFLVDKLLDVKAYDPRQVTPPTNNSSSVLEGVLPDTDQLIHFLSPEKILKIYWTFEPNHSLSAKYKQLTSLPIERYYHDEL